jgi:hypothetical protein
MIGHGRSSWSGPWGISGATRRTARPGWSIMATDPRRWHTAGTAIGAIPGPDQIRAASLLTPQRASGRTERYQRRSAKVAGQMAFPASRSSSVDGHCWRCASFWCRIRVGSERPGRPWRIGPTTSGFRVALEGALPCVPCPTWWPSLGKGGDWLRRARPAVAAIQGHLTPDALNPVVQPSG